MRRLRSRSPQVPGRQPRGCVRCAAGARCEPVGVADPPFPFPFPRRRHGVETLPLLVLLDRFAEAHHAKGGHD